MQHIYIYNTTFDATYNIEERWRTDQIVSISDWESNLTNNINATYNDTDHQVSKIGLKIEIA